MNKKLLFAAMSLAALTACNSDDFESKNVAQQETSPVVFEVLNNNDGFTRASMSGNKVAWSAEDGDLFTLFHGGTLNNIAGKAYQNATFKAEASEGAAATLTTPSMILAGGAVMVWPVDTIFRVAGVPSLVIPEVLPADVENYIPYVSDEINIYDREWDGVNPGVEYPIGADNTAGYNRKYPVYMRPMASQLNLKTDYAGTDATIAQLYEGGSACPEDGGIEPIEVTSVELVASEGNNVLTKEIPLKFTNPATVDGGTGDIAAQWAEVAGNNWSYVTDFNTAGIVALGQTEKLTTKSVQGLDGCKFLILPLKAPLTGNEVAGIVVNTNYGKVIVASNTDGFTNAQYTDAEIGDAWYRYVTDLANKTADETATSEKNAKNQTKVTSALKKGLEQTLNGFSAYTATSGIVKHEPIGASATRYVKVLLKYLQIDGTHIKTNKQLRDIALIWKYLGIGAGGATTVYLDGNDKGEFEITQKTIKLINDLNAAAAEEENPRSFAVVPCNVGGEVCEKIVITGGGDIQNLTFIKKDAVTADVVFKAGETWNWKGTVTLATAATTGVKSIINKGTMENTADATLAIYNNADPAVQIYNVPFVNEGTWKIESGKLNVQFNVTNFGKVEISAGAQYRQDGQDVALQSTFTNDAETLEERFLADPTTEKVGKVYNSGVFAAVGKGVINNYGLIEHELGTAKTFITSNEKLTVNKFKDPFNKNTNKFGRVNLPWEYKTAENLSISAAASQGFVSVTVDGEVSDISGVGNLVNYVIVKSGVSTISNIANVKYLEINEPGTEIQWKVNTAMNYDGLIVLSDINLTRVANVTATTTYLGKNATMYVGGTFNKAATQWAGYYGDTSANVKTNYVTF